MALNGPIPRCPAPGSLAGVEACPIGAERARAPRVKAMRQRLWLRRLVGGFSVWNSDLHATAIFPSLVEWEGAYKQSGYQAASSS